MDLSYIEITDERREVILNGGKIPVVPGFLLKLAIGESLADEPMPTTIEQCAFIDAHFPLELRDHFYFKRVKEIWHDLSEREIDAARDVDEARCAYHRAPEGPVQMRALMRWDSFSRLELNGAYDNESRRRVYGRAPFGSPTRLQALVRMAKFS